MPSCTASCTERYVSCCQTTFSAAPSPPATPSPCCSQHGRPRAGAGGRRQRGAAHAGGAAGGRRQRRRRRWWRRLCGFVAALELEAFCESRQEQHADTCTPPRRPGKRRGELLRCEGRFSSADPPARTAPQQSSIPGLCKAWCRHALPAPLSPFAGCGGRHAGHPRWRATARAAV